MDSALLVDPQSSWTGLDPDSDEKNPGSYFLNSGSDHPDFRRHCLIFWSQVLPHTLVPGGASFSGPRYCLVQGPKEIRKKIDPNWTGNGPFDLKLGPNESNRNFAQF